METLAATLGGFVAGIVAAMLLRRGARPPSMSLRHGRWADRLSRLMDHLGVRDEAVAAGPAARIERGLDALLAAHGLERDVQDRIPSGVREAWQSGGKVAAIKLYRESMGVGLKEAKEAVEELADLNGW